MFLFVDGFSSVRRFSYFARGFCLVGYLLLPLAAFWGLVLVLVLFLVLVLSSVCLWWSWGLGVLLFVGLCLLFSWFLLFYVGAVLFLV